MATPLPGLGAYSEDPDEMPHICGISSWSALFAKIENSAGTEIHHFIEILTGNLLKYKNGQYHTYCINMYGIINQNENGELRQSIS